MDYFTLPHLKALTLNKMVVVSHDEYGPKTIQHWRSTTPSCLRYLVMYMLSVVRYYHKDCVLKFPSWISELCPELRGLKIQTLEMQATRYLSSLMIVV
jgi:hypothetical protein